MFDGKSVVLLLFFWDLVKGLKFTLYLLGSKQSTRKQERARWEASVGAHLSYPVVSPVSRMVSGISWTLRKYVILATHTAVLSPFKVWFNIQQTLL